MEVYPEKEWYFDCKRFRQVKQCCGTSPFSIKERHTVCIVLTKSVPNTAIGRTACFFSRSVSRDWVVSGVVSCVLVWQLKSDVCTLVAQTQEF